MRTRRMHEVSGHATWVVVLETGDEAMACLKRFAIEEGLDSTSLTAIGAFERATLAYFDWERKEYLPIPVDEQVEVASLTGDIVLGPDGTPVVHVHAVLGRRDGSALAGHLDSGFVRPTLELVLTETPGALRKQMDEASGLPLIRP
ncbi:DNA-binding protein [Devosia sp. ZB163]|uniref:PPC domain-containing DNA-binding protein n=1 Tax=Devosia sp. ZB163 TaxID=3025938 RepID=UPI00235F9411|nr:PPC domain-containing DNA-binding protein [Devosia sp. ZB163]MDC9826279.1 DNA-binding protein [Devosia sp. ZB163]